MGQDDSTGKWESAQVADVADIINPTRDCQSSTIASFPVAGDWFTKGGWVDGVLIICSVIRKTINAMPCLKMVGQTRKVRKCNLHSL